MLFFVSVTTDSEMHYTFHWHHVTFFRKIEAQTISLILRLECTDCTISKARFKRRTFHEPNLIAPIKYMTRSTFESIKFDSCYLGRPENKVRHGQSVSSTTGRLRFKRRTFHVPNLMHTLQIHEIN